MRISCKKLQNVRGGNLVVSMIIYTMLFLAEGKYFLLELGDGIKSSVKISKNSLAAGIKSS